MIDPLRRWLEVEAADWPYTEYEWSPQNGCPKFVRWPFDDVEIELAVWTRELLVHGAKEPPLPSGADGLISIDDPAGSATWRYSYFVSSTCWHTAFFPGPVVGRDMRERAEQLVAKLLHRLRDVKGKP
ncbi:MAG TPA: hypothetical protein VF183_07315 [Acidimicrobiales bacterium]